MSAPSPVRLLVIEDEGADLRLVKEALTEIPVAFQLEHAATGVDGLRKLEGNPSAGPLPDAVLLDLNLPGLDGRAVLARIRGTPELAGLPVVVITSSPADSDVLAAFDHRADGYLRKPVSGPELQRVLSRLTQRVPASSGGK